MKRIANAPFGSNGIKNAPPFLSGNSTARSLGINVYTTNANSKKWNNVSGTFPGKKAPFSRRENKIPRWTYFLITSDSIPVNSTSEVGNEGLALTKEELATILKRFTDARYGKGNNNYTAAEFDKLSVYQQKQVYWTIEDYIKKVSHISYEKSPTYKIFKDQYLA